MWLIGVNLGCVFFLECLDGKFLKCLKFGLEGRDREVGGRIFF